MKKQIEYTEVLNFRYRGGTLNGKTAFITDGLAGLRSRVRQIEFRGVISAGYNGIEQLGATRPASASEETSVSAEDFTGAGWYLTKFDGGADRFENEASALVAYIEERTETRGVSKISKR